MRQLPLSVLCLLTMSCNSSDDGSSSTTQGPVVNFCEDSGCDTASFAEPEYMHPIAVGFEIQGVLYEDGTLNPLILDDGTPINPLVRLTFADEEFFSLSGDAQAGHYCEILAEVNYLTPFAPGDEPFDNIDGIGMNWSYEENLLLYYEYATTRCGDVVDPAIWGAEAELLYEAFQNIHFGFGFGSDLSDRMWNAFGGKTDPSNEDIVDRVFQVYIAVNDRDGRWSGCDWTYGFMYEVDDNDVWVEDPKNPGYLNPLPVENIGLGPLPKGYLSTGAYWYQDFPLMSQTSQAPWDFTHLANDPVAGFSDCGQW